MKEMPHMYDGNLRQIEAAYPNFFCRQIVSFIKIGDDSIPSGICKGYELAPLFFIQVLFCLYFFA